MPATESQIHNAFLVACRGLTWPGSVAFKETVVDAATTTPFALLQVTFSPPRGLGTMKRVIWREGIATIVLKLRLGQHPAYYTEAAGSVADQIWDKRRLTAPGACLVIEDPPTLVGPSPDDKFMTMVVSIRWREAR